MARDQTAAVETEHALDLIVVSGWTASGNRCDRVEPAHASAPSSVDRQTEIVPTADRQVSRGSTSMRSRPDGRGVTARASHKVG